MGNRVRLADTVPLTTNGGAHRPVGCGYSDRACELRVQGLGIVRACLAGPLRGAKGFRAAMCEAGGAGSRVSTDDIHALHRALTAYGVTFTRERAEQEYGGIGAVIDDGCGNLFNLHHEPPA